MQVALPHSTNRRAARTAIGIAAAAIALVATPGIASASTTTSSYGSYDSGYGGYDSGYGGYDGGSGGYTGATVVTPVLNCISSNRDGSYTAVLGYKNTSQSTYTITGSYNVITPSRYDGDQPTTFRPGTYRGVLSVTVASGSAYWQLGSTKLTVSRTAGTTCAAGTTLPAMGNGTGVAVALGAAGLVGAGMVRRLRRRVALA